MLDTLLETVIIRTLIQRDYHETWQAMRKFTDERIAETQDEIWLVEHPPVYTLGQAGTQEHILNPGAIPIIKTDRGGQVTYHGPGQLIVYFMLDIRRRHLGVRELVDKLENSVIDLLAEYSLTAQAKREAPGVYVNGAKICSIGLRIRRGCSYHGLALNVAMDLSPFAGINPCGYAGLAVTQLQNEVGITDLNQAATHLINYLLKNLGYTNAIFASTET